MTRIFALADGLAIGSDGDQWMLYALKGHAWSPTPIVTAKRHVIGKAMREAGVSIHTIRALTAQLPEVLDHAEIPQQAESNVTLLHCGSAQTRGKACRQTARSRL